VTQSTQQTYDLFVVGGGINGAGIAADAAGRGLKIGLCEMNDLASATSSASSKLIHGGLRYLEHYEFRLVREALSEREVLLRNAPHIIWPLRFRLPHRPHLRPSLMIRAGLFLYDHLGKRTTLPGSTGLRFGPGSALQPHITKGFEYSDGWVDDARLVVLNALAAQQKGADIMPRTRCVHAERNDNGLWQITLQNQLSGEKKQVTARALVNAAGPWVSSFFADSLDSKPPKEIRMVKGSHMIVPKIHNEKEAYILQNEDQRIVFVIPYENDFSLVGTTDVEHHGDPSQAAISDAETDYLIEVVNNHFVRQISRDDVVHSYAGVRPLMDGEEESAQKASRDYTFEVTDESGKAPLLSVFGGKITTYRKLAEAAVNKLNDYFPEMTPAWTADARLPGGDFDNKAQLTERFSKEYPWLPEQIAVRLVRSYGTLAEKFLQGCNSLEDMGQHFGAGFYQKEVDYLLEQEWAHDCDDLLWRRSKLGLFLTMPEKQALQAYLEQHMHQLAS